MDRSQLKRLLARSEASDLDWKADFPPGLLASSGEPGWEEGKGTLLKDISALANSLTSGQGYIVYGVRDQGGTRSVVGKSRSLDDADLQTWAANAFSPPPHFVYEELPWDDDRSVGVVTVTAGPDFPHVVVRTVGNVLHQGQVWHRRGTQNTVAMYDDLARMFKGVEWISDERTSGPVISKAREHYVSQGREPVLVRWTAREGQLLQGFEIAYFPGTRRPVVAIPYGRSQPDLILMLRPSEGTVAS